MHVKHLPDGDVYVLAPGDFFVTKGQEVLSTLLGSCVSVCLYDPTSGVRGMNHFLLASTRNRGRPIKDHTEAGRYGVHSMELLINSMVKHGANRKNFKAKVFGGAKMFGTEVESDINFGIGETNQLFIREFLELESIPLISENLGGENGRIIYFFEKDYTVLLKPIAKTQTVQVEKEEKSYLQKQRDTAKKKETGLGGNVVLWD